MTWVADYSFVRPDLNALKAAGGSGIVRYATGSGKAVDAGEVSQALQLGLTVTIVMEEGAQPALRGYNGGVADAQAANAAADAVGYSKNSYIYYVLEDPNRLSMSEWYLVVSYLEGVQSVGGRPIGGYGSLALLNYCFGLSLIGMKWAVGPWGGWLGCNLAQYEGPVPPQFANIIDSDLVLSTDYGQDPRPSWQPPVSHAPFAGFCVDHSTNGYWACKSDGSVFTDGASAYHGGANTGPVLTKPVVGMASHPSASGYWMVGSDGGVFSFGAAGFHGSAGNVSLTKPVVGMAVTPSGNGYWLVASDGGVFCYGDAAFYGSAGNVHLTQPVVGMAAHPSGKGYWLTAGDGGVFSFGVAGFHGSTGADKLFAPVVSIATTPSGNGYWLTASDGGVFSFGDAAFHGSVSTDKLAAPVGGMAVTKTGGGYWLWGHDGGVFTEGDASFDGAFVGD